jgi:uncharacterized membrane protein YeaQ/YmgE (transglycosylase-associated protein family)
MVSMFFWAAFGALVGWVAAILQDISDSRHICAYLLAGALGGLAGGFVGLLLSPQEAAARASTNDMIFAVFGATAFVFVAGLAAQRSSRE